MAKITPRKSSTLNTLTDLVAKSKSIAIVDYQGLTVGQATDLRRQLKKVGGQMLITKNTLFKIASPVKDISLDGLSAFIFSTTDEVSAIKTVADFTKKNGVLTFKAGFLGDQLLTANQIVHLSTLPDKNTLLSHTVSSLKSPLFHLVSHLNWNIAQLVRTLAAVVSAKSS